MMAKFKRVRIKEETYPQTICKQIKDLLVIYETVEVVVVEPTPTFSEFELHAWSDVRQDGSNGPEADPMKEY